MKIKDNIFYVGVNDHKIDLFEGHYYLPGGIAYNSYVIMDEKIAVMDSVGEDFSEEWLANIKAVCGDRQPDYIIVQHMEPDHSRNITAFMEAYPDAVVVAGAKAWPMMEAFNGSKYEGRNLTVAEGDTLNLGKCNLKFIAAAMVHWPEVIMTYEETTKTFFSADAFGKFGALDYDDPEGWDCEARRYYFGIVGKYGVQVQGLLKKAATLDIQTICPLHGPVLTENLEHYLKQYNTWSSYGVETDGVAIFYTSVYGNTKKAVLMLEEKLLAAGCPKVAVTDLARDDWAEAVEDAFRYGKIVLATTTYNGDMFPEMKSFINHLEERNWQNKKVAFIENGSWGPVAAKKMKAAVEGLKNLEFIDPVVTIKSALNDANEKAIDELVEILK